MNNYLAIFQHYRGAWFATVPDMPGILVSAEGREEAETKLHEGVQLYLEECQADGKPLPPRETDELSVGIVQAN